MLKQNIYPPQTLKHSYKKNMLAESPVTSVYLTGNILMCAGLLVPHSSTPLCLIVRWPFVWPQMITSINHGPLGWDGPFLCTSLCLPMRQLVSPDKLSISQPKVQQKKGSWVPPIISYLTLMARGFWMQLECRWGQIVPAL